MKNKTFINRIISFILAICMIFCVFSLTISGLDSEYELPWLWPVPDSYKINSLDFYSDGGEHNQGQAIDIGANGYTGEKRLDVVSSTSGNVLYIVNKYDEESNTGSGWGNYVIVRSGNINIIYAHLQSVSCEYGPIKAGDIIGKMGKTGNASGVHLHMQAYYYGESSSSSSLIAFEQFRTNPLYISKLQYASGLKENSKKYSQWISDNYTKLSGGYYSYTGKITSDYNCKKIGAKFTVISPSGASVYSMPVAESSLITDTISFSKQFAIDGYYYDCYGKLWLSKVGGGWIRSENTGFYDYVFEVESNGVNLPSGTYIKLSDIDLGGTITTFNPIVEVVLEIVKGNQTILTFSEKVDNLLKVNLSDCFESFDSVLAEGDYKCKLSVVQTASYPNCSNDTRDVLVAESDFSIKINEGDSVPPIVYTPEVVSISDRLLFVKVKVIDNISVSNVTLTVGNNESGYIVYSYDEVVNNEYSFKIDLNDFDGFYGVLSIKASATDIYNNRDDNTRYFMNSKPASGETWKASSSINTRKGPGTSFAKVGTISKGTKVLFTSVTEDSKYYWAYSSDGVYSVLKQKGETSYWFSYVSGEMYGVVLDYNNGDENGFVTLYKRYDGSLNLSEYIPTKKGYSFEGWALSSNARDVVYSQSDVYNLNQDAYLFAVWKDDEAPVISSVVTDTFGWTNSGVTVTINATDNTDYLLYSFDGGKTWSESNSLYVKTNMTFAQNDIIVSDEYGNIASYKNALKIEYIDKENPNIDNMKVDVSISGNKVNFEINGAIDSLSGLDEYEIIYSSRSDFSNAKNVFCSSKTSLDLDDGIYYLIVKAYDKAGNYSIKECPRFIVGNAVQLASPQNISVSEGSTYCELNWDAVENADGYSLFVSDDDFQTYDVYFSSSETYTIYGLLSDKEYSVKISAISEDGAYSESEFSEISFKTKHSDCELKSFTSLDDASINEALHTADYIAPYVAKEIDITAEVSVGATCEYYLDSELKNKILTPNTFAFTDNSAKVYISITAEDGKTAVYTLRISRALEKAETPIITIEENTLKNTSYVNESVGNIEILAQTSDGSIVTIKWFVIHNNNESYLGETFPTDLSFEEDGEYFVYALATSTNSKCLVTTSSEKTEEFEIIVSKYSSEIVLDIEDTEYTGSSVEYSVDGYDGDGKVSIHYYSDSEMKNEIESPVNVGTYYAYAFAEETKTYYSATSEIISFTISKKSNTTLPEYSKKDPTLRDSNTYIEIKSNGVEFSIDGGEWVPYSDVLVLEPKSVVRFRFVENETTSAGEIVEVTAKDESSGATISAKENSTVTVDDGYIFVREDFTINAKYVLSNLNNSEYITIENHDGEDVDGTICTGFRVVLGDEEGELDSAVIIIVGDVDCNGIVDNADAILIMKMSNGMIIPDEINIKAGDSDGNGVLSTADALLLKLRVK